MSPLQQQKLVNLMLDFIILYLKRRLEGLKVTLDQLTALPSIPVAKGRQYSTRQCYRGVPIIPNISGNVDMFVLFSFAAHGKLMVCLCVFDAAIAVVEKMVIYVYTHLIHPISTLILSTSIWPIPILTLWYCDTVCVYCVPATYS